MNANHFKRRPALIRFVNLTTRQALKPARHIVKATGCTADAGEYDENFYRAELDEPRTESPNAVWQPCPL